MRYITDDDLVTDAQERFINESKADDQESPDKIEARVIDLVITYLSGRYDTGLIFDEDAPVRNELLVSIISKITLYNLFKRNSARKVTTTIKDDYDWAMKELDKINSGRTRLGNLPAAVEEPNQATSDSIWGNISNRDYYI